MKKAVIVAGGLQYLVAEGDEIKVNLLHQNKDTVVLDPLMVVDGKNTLVGKPHVDGVKVHARIVEQDVQDDKVIAIRYKAKKRVHKVRGHRQHHTVLIVTAIK
jgi:large subunit ribosomal protein L21